MIQTYLISYPVETTLERVTNPALLIAVHYIFIPGVHATPYNCIGHVIDGYMADGRHYVSIDHASNSLTLANSRGLRAEPGDYHVGVILSGRLNRVIAVMSPR